MSHAPIGVPKPRFLRFRISGGSRSASARFMTCFSSPPRTLTSPAMRAVISTSSWSSSGTRHSSDVAIVILSVSISRSSGSCVSRVDDQHAVERVVAVRAAERGDDRVVVARGTQHQIARLVARKDLQIGAVALFRRQVGGREEAFRVARQIEQRRVAIGRQALPDAHREAARPAGQRREPAMVVVAEIAAVAAEDLVAADAGQDDRDVAPRELATRDKS